MSIDPTDRGPVPRPTPSTSPVRNAVEDGERVRAVIVAFEAMEALETKHKAAIQAHEAARQACGDVAAGVYLINGDPWCVEFIPSATGQRVSIRRLPVIYTDALGRL